MCRVSVRVGAVSTFVQQSLCFALDKTNFSKQIVKIKFLNDVDLRSVTKPQKSCEKLF